MNEKTITNVLEYLDGTSGKIKGSAIASSYEPAMANILTADIDEAKLTIEPTYVYGLKENSINSKRFN